MATKTKRKSSITTEKTGWGVQLTARPFEGITGSQKGAMMISADVHRPKVGQRAVVRVQFSSTAGSSGLGPTNTILWINTLRGVLDEAQRVGATLKPVK